MRARRLQLVQNEDEGYHSAACLGFGNFGKVLICAMQHDRSDSMMLDDR